MEIQHELSNLITFSSRRARAKKILDKMLGEAGFERRNTVRALHWVVYIYQIKRLKCDRPKAG